MPAPRGIFISYARDDLTVAERLAAALRAGGLEVWLDLEQLTSGDGWDRKIRGQIRDCALFVPIVSAHTQARREGYFRLEWKLADERTHQMAEGTPFILPVVADDTKERDALVPASFLAAQWTRLPHGEMPPAFCVRVRQLLAPEVGASLDDARAATAPDGHGRATPLQEGAAAVGRAPRARQLIFAAIAVLALAAVGAWLFLRPIPPAALSAAQHGAPPTTENSALPKIEAKSIAVLPFKNQSPDPENAFFTEGMHEDILTKLFDIRDLRVVSRTSVEQYRDTKKTIRQIGEELRVAYVLEGSVQRVGNKVRVTGQLIDARTDRHAWAKSFDKELSDIFAIQAEVAKVIAGELQAVISPQAAKLLDRKPTENLDAYDLYLQARDIRNRRSDNAPALEEQEKLFERAVAIDPQFGVAWAKLAWARSMLYMQNRQRTDARVNQARNALETAERLLPDAPEVVLSRGYFCLYVDKDYPRAIAAFQRTAELSPNLSEAPYAVSQVYRRQGGWTKALQSNADARRLEPANPHYVHDRFLLLLAVRRYPEAEAELRRNVALGRVDNQWVVYFPFCVRGELPMDSALREQSLTARQTFALMSGEDYPRDDVTTVNKGKGDLFRPRDGLAAIRKAFALSRQENMAVARAVLAGPRQALRTLVSEQPTNAAFWSHLGVMEALLENHEEALRCVRRSVELVPESQDTWVGPTYRIHLAVVLAWAGDKDAAVLECARLLRTPFHRGRYSEEGEILNVHVMRHHPAFAPLRGDPRFEALLNDPKNNAPLF